MGQYGGRRSNAPRGGMISVPDWFGAREDNASRSQPHLKQKKKWAEARHCHGETEQTAGWPVAPTTSPRGFMYQLMTGHRLTSQYLNWWGNQSTAMCRHGSYTVQARRHVSRSCSNWKTHRRVLWAVVREETGRGNDRFNTWGLLTDECCSQASPLQLM